MRRDNYCAAADSKIALHELRIPSAVSSSRERARLSRTDRRRRSAGLGDASRAVLPTGCVCTEYRVPASGGPPTHETHGFVVPHVVRAVREGAVAVRKAPRARHPRESKLALVELAAGWAELGMSE